MLSAMSLLYALSQIFPDLLIALNRHPSLTPLSAVQRSSNCFAQSGFGTVRMWAAFP